MSTAAQERKAASDAKKAKDVVVKKLTDLGIPFDKSESTENLEIILFNHANPTTPKPLAAKPAAEVSDDFEVGDPELLVPRTRPLVIKQKADVNGGEWFNPSQAEWARILNGYAYQNGKKWNKKKGHLLGVLKELGTLSPEDAAEKLLVLKGGEFGVRHGSEKLKNAPAN